MMTMVDLPDDTLGIVVLRMEGSDLEANIRNVEDAIYPPRQQYALVFRMLADHFEALANEVRND